MKCTVEQKQFLTQVRKIANILCKHTMLPILGTVLLDAKEDRLELTSSCLDISVHTTLTAKVAEPGKTTVPVKNLLELTDRLQGTEIFLHSDKRHHCQITCGNAKFKLFGLNPEDFPAIPETQTKHRIVLRNADCRNLIDRVAYAVSKDETRMVMKGIFFSLKAGVLTTVGTDGRRMALNEAVPIAIDGDDADFILPHKAAVEISRLSEDADTVEFRFDEKHLSVIFGTTTLTAKLIDGRYPDFRKVIPAEFSKTLDLTAESVLAPLELVSVPLNGVGSVALHFFSGSLKLHSEAPTVGEGTVQIDIPYDGEDERKFLFNPEYLRAPLKFSGAETLRLHLNGNDMPVMLTSNTGFKYVLMPIRSN